MKHNLKGSYCQWEREQLAADAEKEVAAYCKRHKCSRADVKLVYSVNGLGEIVAPVVVMR